MSFARPLRKVLVIIASFGGLSLATLQLSAQDPKNTGESKTAVAKKTSDPTRRVPPFFGQIGLSPEQKEQIYKIRAKHQDKLDALEKEMAKIREQMLIECESVLTDSQKKALEGRRSAAETKKSKTATSAKAAEKSPE